MSRMSSPRKRHHSQTGRIAITIGTFLILLGLSGIALTCAVSDTRQQRAMDRAPLLIGEDNQDSPVALWAGTVDTLDDDFSHDVVYVVPIDDEFTPPPGLPRWPEPGEAFMSPGLLKLGEKENIRNRYGDFAGLISDEGLETPSERLVYVNPPAEVSDPDRMTEISGFGHAEHGFPLGEHTYILDSSYLYWGLVGLVVTPGAALLLIGVRISLTSKSNAPKDPLRNRHKIRRTLRSVWPSAITGIALTIPIIATPFSMDTKIPGVNFSLTESVVRDALPELFIALATTLAIAAILTIAASQISLPRNLIKKLEDASTSQRSRAASTGCWIFLFAMLANIRGVQLVGDSVQVPFYAASLVVLTLTLPFAAYATTAFLGRVLISVGQRASLRSISLTGARLSHGPGLATRQCSVLILAILAASQALLWVGIPGDLAAEAHKSRESVGSSVIEVSPYGSKERLTRFGKKIPTDAELLAVHSTEGEKGTTHTTINGSCAALKTVGAPCSADPIELTASTDPRMRELRRWVIADSQGDVVTAKQASALSIEPSDTASVSLVVVSGQNDVVKISDVKQAAYRNLAMDSNVGTAGDSWIVGTGMSFVASDWARLLGVFLVFGLSFAVSATTVSSSRRGGHASGVMTQLLVIPSVLAVSTGLVLATWTAVPMESSGWPHVTLSALVPFAVAASLGVLVALFAPLASQLSRRDEMGVARK